MEKKNTKIKEAPVTKPLKKALNLLIKDKKTGEETEITTLTVIDDEDNVVATFSKADYGPRFWFKAHQYAVNYSDVNQKLRVKELE